MPDVTGGGAIASGVGAIAGGIGSLFGGGGGGDEGSDAAIQAALIQQASANNAIQNYREMYNQTRGDLAPWRTAGTAAVNQYAGILNLPGYTRIDPTEYLRSTPGYQFRLNEGIKALDRTAASKGMLMSGPQYKAINTYGQGLADQTYNSLMDRLFGLSGQGLSAAGQTGAYGMQTAGRIGDATMAGGNAQAMGLMNAYNARQSAYANDQNNLWGGLGALAYGAGKLYNAYGNYGQGNSNSYSPGAYDQYLLPMAEGGPIEPDQPYLVGEEGPEVIVPQRAGFVIPNPMTTMRGNATGDDVEKLINVLKKNEDKNFVQRLMKPDTSPVLMDYAGPGTHGTHLMSSGEYDGKGIAYPEIIQTPDGGLIRLGRKEAQQYAIKNNQYIQFDTPEEAEWFGKNYKRIWGQGTAPVPKKYYNAFNRN